MNIITRTIIVNVAAVITATTTDTEMAIVEPEDYNGVYHTD